MRSFSLLLTVAIITSCQISPLRGQQSDQFREEAGQYFDKALKAFPSVPGAAIAVVKDGKTVFAGGFGLAELENEQPATAETNYYIASATKPFTALLAALLDEEGIIPLDAPITRFFPETSFDPALEADQVLVEDLLTHTSGLNNSPIAFRVAYTGEHNHDILVGLLDATTSNNAGRGNFSYTNVGYNIYALIVKQVTGRSWQELLEEKVFRPLGMERTTAYISRANREDWPMARPYFGLKGEPVQKIYLEKKDNTMQSAGGLITTASDLAKWLEVQLEGGKLNDRQIFPQALIERSHQQHANGTTGNDIFEGEGYGYGWQSGTYKGHKAVWHFGGFPGSYTHVSFLPGQKLGVAVMVNEAVMGYRLMNLFAAFTYDWWLKEQDTDYEKQLEELSGQFNQITQRIQEGRSERAKRTWQLSHPFSFYSGSYTNELYGTIQIEGSDDQLRVRMGNMHCVATPYTIKETVRVELVPGSGEVLKFKIEDNELVGVQTNDEFFEKRD